MRLILSSRKSDLARVQAFRVGAALKEKNIDVEYRFRESLGDKNLVDPLWKMPEKGVFTEDFLEDLISGQTDIVVHSWKDLPIEERPHTKIVATLPRADQRDLLLVRKDKWVEIKNSKRFKVFSSSPRRAYNLEGFFKDALPTEIESVEFLSVRGNVPTRIKKMLESDIHGLVVAKAALDRLLEAPETEFQETQKNLKERLNQCWVMILPLEQNPTAAAQGALAIEINSKRDDLVKIFRDINCEKTFSAVSQEREILKGYGGGCHQKVGASVRSLDFGELTYVRALTDSGLEVDSLKFSPKGALKKVSKEAIFPNLPGEGQWFEREFLEVILPPGPLWVAKSEALPEHSKISFDQLVWTSGWETWKRLAKRGVWVSGCSESLGEDKNFETFSFWQDLKFTKLTHVDGADRSKKILGTYKLIPIKNAPNVKGKTHFYWMSGSSFERALELNPDLKTAHHSCGPGHTAETISKHSKVTIFPSYKIWKEHIVL